jgi:hypothetical protein
MEHRDSPEHETEKGGADMSSDEAKKLVARFVAGYPVGQDELERACVVVRQDADYLRGLGEVLGFTDAPISACDWFAANLDDLATVGWSALQSEMPRMWDHMVVCTRCWHLYWEARKAWGFWERLKAVGCKIIPVIGLLADRFGVLSQFGAGPPAIEARPVGAGMGLGVGGAALVAAAEGAETPRTPPAPRQPWRWELPDSEVGCTIVLEIKRENEEFTLRCNVEIHATSQLRREAFRCEVREDRDRESPLLTYAGPISARLSCHLRAGAWTIRVFAQGYQDCQWQIPLVLTAENPD